MIKSLAFIAGAAALVLAVSALPEPARPSPAIILELSQLATERQDAAAEMRLRHWAGTGMPEARRELGRLWLRRDGMQRDAFHQMELAARDGDAEAALMMGNWLRNSPQAARALQWYRMAAERGSAQAALALGQMALAGEGMQADRGLARRWLERAADMGSTEARSLVSFDRA